MSGRIVKAMSLLLCAVLVAVSCLVGCDSTPSLTREELLEVIQEDFPEAHISNGYYDESLENKIAIREDEKNCEWFVSYSKTNDISRESFDLRKLFDRDATKELMNTILPVFIEKWDESDTLQVMILSKPNGQFTEWGDEYEIYEKSGWRVFAINYSDGMSICVEPIR